MEIILYLPSEKECIFTPQIHSQKAGVQKADQTYFRKDVFNMAGTAKIKFLLRKPWFFLFHENMLNGY